LFGEEPSEATLQFYLGLMLGITFTACGACLIAFYSGLPQAVNHEALIAGLLSVAAGSISVYVIYRQIVQTHLLSERERNGRATRSRVLLSQPLVDLSEYAKKSIVVIFRHYPEDDNETCAVRPAPAVDAPDLPVGAIALIGEAIQNVDEASAQRLAAILSAVQIQRARVTSALDAIYERGESTSVMIHNLDDYVVDSLTIIARCSK
jgi:hypothetical protein